MGVIDALILPFAILLLIAVFIYCGWDNRRMDRRAREAREQQNIQQTRDNRPRR